MMNNHKVCRHGLLYRSCGECECARERDELRELVQELIWLTQGTTSTGKPIGFRAHTMYGDSAYPIPQDWIDRAALAVRSGGNSSNGDY